MKIKVGDITLGTRILVGGVEFEVRGWTRGYLPPEYKNKELTLELYSIQGVSHIQMKTTVDFEFDVMENENDKNHSE